MTTPILFLLGAVALSSLGGLIVWIASRPRPERFGSTIETFNRDLDALAPPGSMKRQSAGKKPVGQGPSATSSARQQYGASMPDRPRPGPRPSSGQNGN